MQAENLNLNFGAIPIYHDASFKLESRDKVGIVGVNGAGKSTILKTVSGLMHPRSGSIQFMDENIAHMEAHKLVRKGLAHVPEGRRIFLQMSVQENLEMGAYINKEVSQADLDMVFNYFPRLKERRKQIAGTLSGGNQQKVVLAKWLASTADILIFDEPTRGIDVGAKVEIYNLMNQLKKQGIAVMFVSSELPEVLGIADRVIVMCDGRITGELPAKGTTQNQVLELATAFENKMKQDMEGK